MTESKDELSHPFGCLGGDDGEIAESSPLHKEHLSNGVGVAAVESKIRQRRLHGTELCDLLSCMQDNVSEMMNEHMQICLARIGEGVALQHKAVDHLDEIYRCVVNPVSSRASLESGRPAQSASSLVSIVKGLPSKHTRTSLVPSSAGLTSRLNQGKRVRPMEKAVHAAFNTDRLDRPTPDVGGRRVGVKEPKSAKMAARVLGPNGRKNGEDDEGARRSDTFKAVVTVDTDEQSPMPSMQSEDGGCGKEFMIEDDNDGFMDRQHILRSAKTALKLGGVVHRDTRNMIAVLVQHSYFDLGSGLLILLSTIVVGAETEYMAQHGGDSTGTYASLRTVFFFAFLLELLMRLAASGREFIVGEDRSWNLFDSIMVLSSFVEFVFQAADPGGTASTGRVVRILRIVRITRAMRIGRILRYARTFRQIAFSLQSSMGTLFWAMVMIFLVVYCFAICFCQATTDHLADVVKDNQEQPEYVSELREHYKSVPTALFSLYKAMTGGRNWGEVISPLLEISPFYPLLFLFFISLTFFGVLNVVTAIFVDSALQSQQHEKDLLIQENILKKQLFSDHLRQVFKEIDQDGSGAINGDEMEYFLSDPQLNLYLESIDIFPNDARGLFRLLDRDDSGEVSIDEFCEGCLRLKGEAKSFDIHCLIYNTERTHRRIEQIIQFINHVNGHQGHLTHQCPSQMRSTVELD